MLLNTTVPASVLLAALTTYGQKPATGYVNPKYLIMGVTYAPPGGSASSVSYQTTNVVGNTSMNSTSFTNGVSESVSVSTSLHAFLDGQATGYQSGGWTQKTTVSKSVTLTKTDSTTLKTSGVPNVYSPVNHDYDIIWLWLNPVAVFTLSTASDVSSIVWNGYGFDANDPLQDIDVWPVYVGYLNGDFGPLDAQDAAVLSRSWVKTQAFGPGQGPGITAADYRNILGADKFAYNPYDANSGYVLTLIPGTNPPTSTDGRFTASEVGKTTPQSVPYAQAPPDSTTGIQDTYQSVYSTMTTITNTSDYTYTVGFGLEQKYGGNFLDIAGANADFKVNWNMSWEYISQTSNTNTNTQTDTAVITGPPCPAMTAPCNPEYTEPHEFAVYQDNLYGTFMFWPNPYFSISNLAPATNAVAPGDAVSYTISTLANAGYSGTSISFNVTGLPAGASFNNGTVAPGGPFALTVSTRSATPIGSYPLTISATDGSQSYFTYATLVVSHSAPSRPIPPTELGVAVRSTTVFSNPNPCDLNQDGLVNSVDVVLAVDMTLGLTNCAANINGLGVCNVATVQRVINASLGDGCLTGSIISLSWVPSASSNIVGYNVYIYLGKNSGGTFARVNSSLVVGSTFIDALTLSYPTYTVLSPMYYYVVTSVDEAGVESAYSNEVSAVVPASLASAEQISLPNVAANLGDSVAADVQFVSGGTPITGLVFDLEFDPGLSITATIATGGANAGKTLFMSSLSQGAARFLAVGANQTAIAEGNVITLSIFLARMAGIDKTYLLHVSNASATDKGGNSLPLSAIDGTITFRSRLLPRPKR